MIIFGLLGKVLHAACGVPLLSSASAGSCPFAKRHGSDPCLVPCVLRLRAGIRNWSTPYVKHALMACNRCHDTSGRAVRDQGIPLGWS